MPSPDDVLGLAVTALQTARLRNADRWPPAIAVLDNAVTIWCVGIGKSGHVAQKLAATLRSFGRLAHFLHPVEALHGDAGALRAGDALVVISASGRTAELTRFLVGARYPLVAITTPDSPLGDAATAVLDASVDEEIGGLAPVTAHIVAVALADALALQLRSGGALVHPGGFIGLASRTVGSLMLPAPLVDGTTTVAACIPSLKAGAVLVSGGGIFTDGDLRRAVGSDPSSLSRRVGELCTPNPVTVREDDLASLALDKMERRTSQLTVLPVVDEVGDYVGIVRLHDLVRAGLGA